MSSFLEMLETDRNHPGPWLRPRRVSPWVGAPAARVWSQAVFAKNNHTRHVSRLAPSPHKAVPFSGEPLKKASLQWENAKDPSKESLPSGCLVFGKRLLGGGALLPRVSS